MDPPPFFHRLEFPNLTLLLRANAYNMPEDAPDSSCILASTDDKKKWFAVSERTATQERYHLEKLNEADMAYISSGFLKVSDPKPIDEFKKRHDPAKKIEFFLPSGAEEVPVARSEFFRRQTYQKLIALPESTSCIHLVSITADDVMMTVDLFHRHEHISTRDDDYDRTVYVSTRIRFVPFEF